MGYKACDTIELAIGPYDVTVKNAQIMAKKIKFRHYKQDEMDLARDFISKPYIVGRYYFDYYLMTVQAKDVLDRMGPPLLKDIVPWMQRIDAILLKGKKVFIIEFKERLRSSGIGQLVTYKELYQKQYEPNKEIEMLYVVQEDNPTLHPILERLGIKWLVIEKTGDVEYVK